MCCSFMVGVVGVIRVFGLFRLFGNPYIFILFGMVGTLQRPFLAVSLSFGRMRPYHVLPLLARRFYPALRSLNCSRSAIEVKLHCSRLLAVFRFLKALPVSLCR